MRLRVLDDLGARKLSDLTRLDLQAIADSMLKDGCEPSTIRNAFMPLRALYRRETGWAVAVNPTVGLELPAVRGRRDRIATPAEAAALVAALPDDQRALWATAFTRGCGPASSRRSGTRMSTCRPA